MTTSDHQGFQARPGAILERYGMTETGMNTSNPYEAGPRKAGTVSVPLAGVKVRIANRESGAPVEGGEIGVVEVGGSNVFAGYWQYGETTYENPFRTVLIPMVTGNHRVAMASSSSVVDSRTDFPRSSGMTLVPPR